ncbi:MAG TPA: AMP-binding protein [Polyangiaceae bacterium]|nr:AMP-binding protein [Polyangiaceae bacterium]
MTPAPENVRPGSIEDWAERAPGRAALWENGGAVSYRELDDAANRVAAFLANRGGVTRGDRVAVCTKNRVEWFVSQAAIAKLGATLVPISYKLTPAEVHYIAADSGAVAFVFDAEDVAGMARVWTDEPRTDVRSAVRVALSVVRTRHPGVVTFADVSREGPLVPRFSAAEAASIVYTSGTTGRPRGVVLARRGSGRVSSVPAREPQRESSPPRNLLGAPLNHAAGQASARATLSEGGTVYVMPRFDAEEALRIIARERVTTTFLVPTMLERIVRLPETLRARYDVSSIRVLQTGASPCPQQLKERVIAYFGAHCLVEGYGSTEVGLVSRMRPDDHLRKPGSCGRLLPGVELRIVDDDGNAVEGGAVGEIHVRTPVMIERYLNRGAPEELRDGFFSTGDVGRLDDEGFLYVLDRKKDMIIAGGVNIYPAEIESVVRKHPGVLDVAVFGAPHPELGEQVKAVVERVPGDPVSEAELLEFLAVELAPYKRPRSIEFVAELPRNAAGKVLKAELRAPHWKGVGRTI